MHAPIPNTGLSSIVLSTDSLLTAPGIGLFIMVSGALLLPVRLSTKEFLRKRLGKVAAPTIVWTIVYYTVAPWTKTVHRGESLGCLLSIPFSAQFNGVLWFMYMLIGLYLLAPILSAWLQNASKREIEFYLGLWMITLCYPLIRSFISVNEGNTGILYYFGGYAGYFLLGYYLQHYQVEMPIWNCVVMIALPFMAGVMLKALNINIDFYDLFWYLSALTSIACIGWFCLMKRLTSQYSNKKEWHSPLILISNYCFGIYLSHIFIMRGLLWHWEWLRELEGVTQILVTTFITFIGSFFITWFLSHLPGAGYIIGYKFRK